jgi:hypothetical protein
VLGDPGLADLAPALIGCCLEFDLATRIAQVVAKKLSTQGTFDQQRFLKRQGCRTALTTTLVG